MPDVIPTGDTMVAHLPLRSEADKLPRKGNRNVRCGVMDSRGYGKPDCLTGFKTGIPLSRRIQMYPALPRNGGGWLSL